MDTTNISGNPMSLQEKSVLALNFLASATTRTLLQSLVAHLSSPLPSKNLEITRLFTIVFTIPIFLALSEFITKGDFINFMEMDRPDGRSPNQLRPLACSRSVLHRAHGSATWAQGETKVLAAVYGPKAGTKKNENPEKASIEIIWKPNTGHIGQADREHEMILKKTFESICIRTIYPNTTTSIVIQVVLDDGALLPCAINAACAALVDAGIPLRHLAVAICCSVTDNNCIILDPSKQEEEKAKAFAYLVFPNTTVSVVPEKSLQAGSDPMAHGIITSVTHGAMSVDDYLHCLERGRATTQRLSEFLRKNMEPKSTREASKAG